VNDTDDPLDDLDELDWSYLPHSELGDYHVADDDRVRNEMTTLTASQVGGISLQRADRLQPFLERDGRWCGICHRWLYDLSAVDIDHVTPRKRGGCDHFDNLQLAHRSCNNRKGAATDAEDTLRRQERDVPTTRPCPRCSGCVAVPGR